tara:strand:- start:245 stop:1039 length:795 start_codon:yes stop_codon:yes gene_type:complete
MINFTKLAFQEFDHHITSLFSHDIDHVETLSKLRKMAQISFTQFTKSNSLYFTLGHALSTALVGVSILDAIKSHYGLIRESEAINLMSSIFYCNIGIVQNILNDDKDNYVKISSSEFIDISESNTNSCLWKYKTYRSKEFIKDAPFISSNINTELVNRAIDASDLTIGIERHQEIGEITKLVRATQIISLMADENIARRQVEFYNSAIEGGALDTKVFASLGDFRDKFGHFFWEVLYPDVGDVLLLLRETIVGRKIVSKIYAHL